MSRLKAPDFISPFQGFTSGSFRSILWHDREICSAAFRRRVYGIHSCLLIYSARSGREMARGPAFYCNNDAWPNATDGGVEIGAMI